MDNKGTIFEKNIEILEANAPDLASSILKEKGQSDLEALSSKNGQPSLKVGGIALHSLYDPEKEAKGWVAHHKEKIEEASGLVVLGFGLGYHLDRLCNLDLCRVSGMDIVVFEPRLDILRKALELLDLTCVLSRVTIVTDERMPCLQKGFEVLEHKPSVTLSQPYFVKLLSGLTALQRIKKGLKILVVGPIYGGSQPIAGYCAEALRKLGHDVDFMDNGRYSDTLFSVDKITANKEHRERLKAMLSSFVSEAVMARCAEFKPDLVFALAQAPISEDCLKRLKENGVPTAFWFVEDFRLMDYWRGVAPLYDYFFTIQRGEFFDSLKERGVAKFSYLPLAAAPDVHKSVDLTVDEIGEFGSDLSFVGAGYYNRRNLFKGLVGRDFRIWGSDWDMNSPLNRYIQRSGARIKTEDTVKIFSATRININLHSSTYHAGVNPYGDFVNPRTFELAACGSFQLTDFRSELPELFKIGEEIVCFEDLDDLKEKITYYLDNTDERKRIAGLARERVLKEHTYEKRMEEMLDFLAMNGYAPPRWESEGEDVEGLIDRAGRDTEMGMYLSRFSERERITISDILDEIREGKGRLSEVERMFQLIKELRAQFAPDTV